MLEDISGKNVRKTTTCSTRKANVFMAACENGDKQECARLATN